MASLDAKMVLALELKTHFSWWDALKLRLAGPHAQQLVITRLKALNRDGQAEHESVWEGKDDGTL